MSTFNGSVRLNVTASLSEESDLTAATVNVPFNLSASIADGDTANKAERVWADVRSLAIGASEALDLSGSLIDGLGHTIAFNRVIAFVIQAGAANDATITIGGAVANAWEPWAGASGDKIKLNHGAVAMLFDPSATGFPVTAGTADQLKILNDSATAAATYTIYLIGSEA